MRQLTENEADNYIEAAEVEFTHCVQSLANVHIGRNAEGVIFVLLMDMQGRAVVTERM